MEIKRRKKTIDNIEPKKKEKEKNILNVGNTMKINHRI